MKKIIIIALSLILILSAVLFTGCDKEQESQFKKQEINKADASSKVKNSEVANISLDSAIDIALKDAGVQREDALFYASPSLDKDDEKPHYDIEFKYNDVEYEYEISVNNGAVMKSEKEKIDKKVDEKLNDKKINEPVKEKEEKKTSVEPSTSVPVKQDNSYISVEKAKQIALENAGVKSSDAVFKKAYYDSDDLIAHFDIKFIAGGYEYEYEIEASSGKVLEKDIEKAPIREETPQNNESEYISEDEAKAIAFAHAKVESKQVKYSKAELDSNDIIVHYEVEFVANGYEYEYEINAESGKIIAFNKEFND